MASLVFFVQYVNEVDKISHKEGGQYTCPTPAGYRCRTNTAYSMLQHTKDNERESTRICKIPKKGSLAFVHIDVCSSKNTIIGSWQVPIISYVDKTLENWPLVQSFIKQWQL